MGSINIMFSPLILLGVKAAFVLLSTAILHRILMLVVVRRTFKKVYMKMLYEKKGCLLHSWGSIHAWGHTGEANGFHKAAKILAEKVKSRLGWTITE